MSIIRFVNLRTTLEMENLQNYDSLKKKFSKLVAKNETEPEKSTLDTRELFSFICQSTTDDDINLIIELIRKFVFFLITVLFTCSNNKKTFF